MHSVAFQIGPFAIYWYGILTALGFVAGFWIACRRAPSAGISPDAVSGLAPWLIIGAVLGARSLYVLTHWREEFASSPTPLRDIFNLRSGLVFYGGLIGASLGTILYARLKRLHLWKLADVMSPSIALGHAFGRIGCLMTGCCYGRACAWPWAIHFPKEHATSGAPVHPTQIYEAALNFALFLGLTWFYPRKKFDGQVFSVYLIAYAVLRGVVEFFRGDYAASSYHFGVLAPGQAVSIGVLLAGLVLGWMLRPVRKPAQA